MQLTLRQKRILLGVLHDRDLWAPQSWSGAGFGVERQRTADAREGFVRLAVGRWLGREITPSQSTMNSRAYKSLEKLGLVKRHNFDGERKATHLQLTEAGEKVARQLTKDEAT